MTTIALTPENAEKQLRIIYEEVIQCEGFNLIIDKSSLSQKKQKKQSFREMVNDPSNTSYGPFEGNDAINFLRKHLKN